MVKILLLILCFTMTGCAEWQAWDTYAKKVYNQSLNIKQAVDNKENLMSLTAQQIVDKFGTTDDVSTSYNAMGKTDFETYTYTDTFGNKYSFNLTLTNDVVTAVHYD